MRRNATNDDAVSDASRLRHGGVAVDVTRLGEAVLQPRNGTDSVLRSALADWPRAGAVAAMLIYGIASVLGAWLASPTRTEPAHLAAGLSHWRFADFSLFHVNPPLVRLLAALPALAANPATDWSQYERDPSARPEFSVGRSFVKANGERTVWLMFLARLAILPFGLLGAWICHLWARELYGGPAGLTALVLWCFCPLVLGHGCLIAPDVPAAAMGACACYLFWRWLREPGWGRAAAAGVALGLAELSKFTWVVLFGVWPAMYFARRLLDEWSWRAERHRGRSLQCLIARRQRDRSTCGPHDAPRKWLNASGVQFAGILALALYVVNACYCFDGSLRPLGDFRFASVPLRGDQGTRDKDSRSTGNRFAGTWLGRVPVPLPTNYVVGMDTQKRDFEICTATFFRGQWLDSAPGWAYLYALGVKLPLGTLVLMGLALVLTIAHRECNVGAFDEVFLLAPAAAIVAVAWFHTTRHTNARYMLPVLPPLFIWTSKVARCVQARRWRFAVPVGAALAWSVASSVWYWPHGLAYFNESAGGPVGGASVLTESNVDWGQDLLRLKAWIDSHPEARPLHAALAAGYDPRDIGLDYEPLNIPPEQGGAIRAPPGWYAISEYDLRGPTDELSAFLRLVPVDRVGYSIRIYHVVVGDARGRSPSSEESL